MKFNFWIENNKTYIKAIVEKESEKFGYRAEGPFPKIEMIRDTVIIDYVPKNEIHPDIIGLMCMVCFYPYCKDKVTFPKPVSKYFKEAFGENNLKLHEVINSTYQATNAINIQNVDYSLEKYQGQKYAVSYGGGMDSTALYALFPDAIFIHEQIKFPNGVIEKDNAVNNIEFFNQHGTESYSIPNNNRRSISKPSGWASWPACALNSLLMASDLNIGYIFTGTVLAALFLYNGKKFFPADNIEKQNKWVKAFEIIGIPLVQVTGGVTEVGNAKILMDNNLMDLPVWCNKDNGNNCHLCWKCFRRDTILNAIGFRNYSKKYWERYNRPEIINKLNEKPLFMGHIFQYTFKKLQHIPWIKAKSDYLPDTDNWIMKYYSNSLNILPKSIVNDIQNRIENHLSPITNKFEIELWNQEDFLKGDKKYKNYLKLIQLIKEKDQIINKLEKDKNILHNNLQNKIENNNNKLKELDFNLKKEYANFPSWAIKINNILNKSKSIKN